MEYKLYETVNYLATSEKFGHLTLDDVLKIAKEIHLAVERTERQYKTDFVAIRKAKAMLSKM